ncbi:hypothetical protein L198_00801 [Cryptococcus wingfieldii CBS 7118]|uniref:Uncharacterized protein n=1 Tax=Cryptococcus wingfieldii CBS 7118 TaxID=1295528 RepID=A0A1E3K4Q1_9TREE|nr:hypothetical protein L198_00801 [Cryptococcus wingfieldii CBS 7118]ODO07222.1 hypothetical protein L198_00801 [Cryptococcus wingfieldii CBS 7118]
MFLSANTDLAPFQLSPVSSPSKIYNLHREQSFYQEAFFSSLPYIQQLQQQLVPYGFREINIMDEAMLKPVIQPSFSGSMILNLISAPLSPLTATESLAAEEATGTIHLLQLPLDLTTFFAPVAPYTSVQPACYENQRRIAFATIVSPSTCLITPETMAIPPLRDLIHFLQCLLPSSSALSLSSVSSATKDQYPGADRSSAAAKEAEDRVNEVALWRQGVKPDVTWLDKNELVLRDTVGCSYFRSLRKSLGEGEPILD